MERDQGQLSMTHTLGKEFSLFTGVVCDAGVVYESIIEARLLN